jgi:hypothetical protein
MPQARVDSVSDHRINTKDSLWGTVSSFARKSASLARKIGKMGMSAPLDSGQLKVRSNLASDESSKLSAIRFAGVSRELFKVL